MQYKIYDAGRRNAKESGYGLISQYFGSRLKDLGHEVSYYDEDPNSKADIWLWIRPPHYIKYPEFDTKNINVFYTMHEDDKLEGWKSDWINLLNKCNAVIVPTEWNKEVFSRLGLHVPIYVVPLGADVKTFIGAKTYEFSIFSVHEGLGKDSSREDWKSSVAEYYRLFYNNHNTEVVYTIKSWNMSHPDFEKYQESFKYDRKLLPPIRVIDASLEKESMNDLYTKSWAFLKNSKREGWCLPALEAILCGTRVISRNLPSMPYLNETNCDFFSTNAELNNMMWENWRRYRKYRVQRNRWSWKEAVKKLDVVLREIYEKSILV